jgi:hypothetical protein
MNLFEIFPKLAEHRVPISALDIEARVFFHWKEKGVIDYAPYIDAPISETNTKKVRKWAHLNAFDMLWLLMVKELRKYNMDLETIIELKEYLNQSMFKIGKDSFKDFTEEEIRKSAKAFMPTLKQDKIAQDFTANITAEKLDDLVQQIGDVFQPFFTILGSAFLSVLIYDTNPILMIKNKINSNKLEFELRVIEIAMMNDKKAFVNQLLNDINQRIVLNIPIRPFFEFIFEEESMYKYTKAFELFNAKEQKILEIMASGDYKEINITKDSKGILTIKSKSTQEVKDKKAKEIRRLLGLNQYETAEVIFRNDKHLVINNTQTQKIE